VPTWIERWNDLIAAEPALPGVWARRDGGFHVRGRVRDPRTRRRLEVNRALPDVARARDALLWLEAEMSRRRAGGTAADRQDPLFSEYALQVFKRKIDLGRIRSAAGKEKWRSILAVHLIPSFGPLRMGHIAPSDVKAWQGKLAARIRRGTLKPSTANTALAVLRQIFDEAIDDFDIRDPMRGVDAFDTREHVTYPEESPNSLAPVDVPRFLAAMGSSYPQFHAMTVLAFTTGLRPSSLRPLRRSGPDADLKWSERVLLIRRSHTIGPDVMATTKTDRHQRLHLPEALIDVLRRHCDEQLTTRAQRASDLLFPNPAGKIRSKDCLADPFTEMGAKIGLSYPVSPRAARRTYQDLCRAAGVADIVTRSISGHSSATMQARYSTVNPDEQREAMAKVIDLAVAREARTR
jgi:integrase